MAAEKFGRDKQEAMGYLAEWRDLLGIQSYESVEMIDLAEGIMTMDKMGFGGDESRRRNQLMAVKYLAERGSDRSVPALLYAWSGYLGEEGEELNGDRQILEEIEGQLQFYLPQVTGESLMAGAEEQRVNWLGWVVYRMDLLPEGEMVRGEHLELVLERVKERLDVVEVVELEPVLAMA